MQEIATKSKNAIYDTKLLLDDVRKFTRGNNIGIRGTNFPPLLGYSFSGEENGFLIVLLNGDSNGGILGWDNSKTVIYISVFIIYRIL